MGKLREVFEATSGAAARLQPAAAAKDASVPQPAEAFTAAAANGPQPVATASASAAEDKVGTSLLCCQLRSLPVHHQSYKKNFLHCTKCPGTQVFHMSMVRHVLL